MKISIIIPVFNSEESLFKINNEIIEYFNNKIYNYEIIYVNDNSTDNSENILNDLCNKNIDSIKIINLKKNYGQQNAIFCGLYFSSGDLILTMDDDLQHNINDIDKMISKINDGYDLVYGIYNNRNKKNIRNIGSKITSLFFKYNYRNLKNNRVSSFRMFKSEIVIEILECEYKFIYISAIMLNYTDKIANVYVTQRERNYGQSGYNFKKLLKLFLKLNIYYSKFSFEFIKSKKNAYEIKSYCNIRGVNYEKNFDVRSRGMSIKCD